MSQTLRSLLVKGKDTCTLIPGFTYTFSKPLNCFGALPGIPIYNCATSIAPTLPVFAIVAVTVASVSNRRGLPPERIVVFEGRDVRFEEGVEMPRAEYLKVV